MVYNVTNPVAVIFDRVNGQLKLGELDGKPYTPHKLWDLPPL